MKQKANKIKGQTADVANCVKVCTMSCRRFIVDKIAFQQDVYRPRVDRISQHALCWGGVCSRGVSAVGGCLLPGGYPSMH